MAGSEWPLLLDDPSAVTALFREVPDLTGFRLISLHVDERGPGVTACFERYGLPDLSPPRWREQRLNAFAFALLLDAVTGLRIAGWHGTPPDRIALTSAGGGPGVRFTVSGPHHDVEVTAATARVTRVTAFLASPAAR
ncbi:Imm50 family immunity protein [Streptomyces sp. NPDC049040]|uniref:Imm50 family immunity protein n=1 Tax=Streptomyces sp. NPDC049040 TaxID=3365593 RepID=UPI0037231845